MQGLLRNVVRKEGSKCALVKLSNGALMPQLGLGTYELRAEQCIGAVRDALKLGYRHIDTAGGYRNEELVAKGIEESGVPREDIFITSKLPPTKHGEGAYDECLASLERLKTGWVDLYLLHWPGVAGCKLNDPSIKETRKQSWVALERLYREGKCKAIGVSNFMPLHLKHFCEEGRAEGWLTVAPHVNQFELHPLLKQMDAVQASIKHGIAVEAYSSLARGNERLLKSEAVLSIASAHAATPSQVCLAWALQRGVIVIPKSSNPDRLKENLAACDVILSDDELAVLDGLEDKQGSQRMCWNPHTVEV